MEKTFYLHKISDLIRIRAIVTVHYQELLAGYVSEEESHDFWELIYADRKDITVVTEGAEAPLKQGNAMFVRPKAPHFVKCEKDANIFIISFETRSESMAFFSNRILPIPKERRALLQTLMGEALNTFRIPDFDPALNKLELLPSPKLGGEQLIKNALEMLLIYLLRDEEGHTPRYFVSKIEDSDALEDEILNILNAHVYDTFSLDEICETLHYGKTHLCTFFKQKTGKSIYRTYLSLKMDEAKKLIRAGEKFTEIAYRLGYSSPAHFSDAFKKINGCTPLEYQSSIKT